MKCSTSLATSIVLLALLPCGQKESPRDQPSPPTPPAEDKTAREQAEKAQKEAEEARRKIEEMKKQKAREDAPKKVTVSSLGCQCAPGKKIIVSCQLSSKAEVPVKVEVAASASTKGWVFLYTSAGSAKTALPPGGSKVVQVETVHKAMSDCSSAGSCSCSLAEVTPTG